MKSTVKGPLSLQQEREKHLSGKYMFDLSQKQRDIPILTWVLFL